MHRRHLVAALTLVLLVTAFSTRSTAGEPALGLHGDAVRLPEGTDSATVGFLVKGTDLPQPTGGEDPPPLQIEDLGGEGPGLEVAFSTPAELGEATSATRYWQVDARFSGIEPESELTRTAKLAVGSVLTLVDYTLSNTTSGEFKLEVTPPPPDLVLGKEPSSRRTSLAVTTGDRPATNVRIVQSTLVDPDTKRLLSTEYLRLVRRAEPNREGQPPSAVHIGPGTTEELVIEVDRTFSLPGSFAGSVVLTADQSPETKTIQTLTVHNSPPLRHALGVLALLVGLVLSIYVGVVAKRRANRLAALRAAAQVRQRLAPLGPTLGEAAGRSPGSVDRLQDAFKDTRQVLSESYLEGQGLLPPRWYSPVRSAQRASRLEKHLTAVAKRVAVLHEIVARGVETVLSSWDGGDLADHENALRRLDGLADSDKEIAGVKQEVSKILNDLRGSKQTLGSRGLPTQAAPRTTRQLDVELHLLGATVWLLWTAVTVVSGWAALILTNPGFGTGLDIAGCFFWGLGVHLAGGSLQQLSPSKVATRFNIELPESG